MELPFDMQKGIIPFEIGSKMDVIELKPIFSLDFTLIAAKNCSNCPTRNFDSIQSEKDGSLVPTGKVYRNNSMEISIKNSSYSV
jgi:hypothetical protein